MKITKEEALTKIAELQEFIKWEDEVILVPDNIKVEDCCGYWDELWIIFNGGKQCLYCDFTSWENNLGLYAVSSASDDCFQRCKLVKVNPEDRKVGYTYYHSDEKLYDIGAISHYCKYLWEWKYAHTAYWQIYLSSQKRNDRYQVVPF